MRADRGAADTSIVVREGSLSGPRTTFRRIAIPAGGFNASPLPADGDPPAGIVT